MSETGPDRSRALRRARDLIDADCGRQLDVITLARAATMSRAHFSREFRLEFGISPHRYVIERRLERAALLLRTTDDPIGDICRAVGLHSVGSFTTSFGRAYGLSPAAYRSAQR